MLGPGQAILAALAAASNPNVEVRRQGEAQLEHLKTSDPSGFFAACSMALTEPSVPPLGRQQIGLLIKNSMAHPACHGGPELRQRVLDVAIADQDRNVRSAASTIISNAVRNQFWPLEPVVAALNRIIAEGGADPARIAAVHGATQSLSQVVDDCIYLLDAHELTRGVVSVALPLLGYPSTDAIGVDIREKALDILRVVLEQAGIHMDSHSFAAAQPHVGQLMEGCFANLRSPPTPTLAAKCAKCIVLSMVYYATIRNEVFHTIMELMLQATRSSSPDGSEELQIEATEFWRAVIMLPQFSQLALPVLPRVIPAIIAAMQYSDMEIGMRQADTDDWNVPDKPDDVKPRHYPARTQATSEDDEDDGDEEGQEWNLRRVSALTLDTLAEYYGDGVLRPAQAVILDMMQPGKPWKELEAAILGLGAIMDGCFDSMTPHLPDISARLLDLLESPSTHFLVVTITLWALTKIGRYVVTEPGKLHRLLRGTFQHMQSPSKVVQTSAINVLTEIVGLCEGGQLDASVIPITECIATCMPKYQLKNQLHLLEALETICEHLSEPLSQTPGCFELLMPPLGRIWQTTPNDSPLLFSFFTCMASVCQAFGPSIQPMAKEIFDRAYDMLAQHMRLRLEAARTNQDPPEQEFLVTSVDLLSGLFDAQGSGLEPLVAAAQPEFMEVVLTTLVDESAGIRQSGFSLVGDVAKACPRYVQRLLPRYVEAALQNLAVVNERTYGVVSNVSWSLNNILENQMDMDGLTTLGKDNALPSLFVAMARILAMPGLTEDMRNMAENICLSLGMMLYCEPDLEHAANCRVVTFARPWLDYMRFVHDVSQKDQALCGFLCAMGRDVSVVAAFLPNIVEIALSLTSEDAEVKLTVKKLLQHVQQLAPPQWQQHMTLCGQQSQHFLYTIYGV